MCSAFSQFKVIYNTSCVGFHLLISYDLIAGQVKVGPYTAGNVLTLTLTLTWGLILDNAKASLVLTSAEHSSLCGTQQECSKVYKLLLYQSIVIIVTIVSIININRLIIISSSYESSTALKFF